MNNPVFNTNIPMNGVQPMFVDSYRNPFATMGYNNSSYNTAYGTNPYEVAYAYYDANRNLAPATSGRPTTDNQAMKINPNVLALISPIIDTMTQYEAFKKSSSNFGMWNPENSLTDFEKKNFDVAKKRCVHLIRDVSSGNLIPTLEEFDDDKFKCRLCGRFVYKKFNNEAVDMLKNAISVLNMLAFFGMTLNMTPEHMSKVIFLKEVIPEAIQLVDIMNKFVNEENNALSSSANIGEASRNAEFRTGNMLNFGI